MSLKTIFTDFKTRVESNIQEALRPIDGITSQGIPDAESELLKKKVQTLTTEGLQLAHKLAIAEEKLKSRSVDAIPKGIEHSDHEKEISDLQFQLATLSQEFTAYRAEKELEITQLTASVASKQAEITKLEKKLKILENPESRNFQISDWQRRYETALQAIGELEERLEETEEEISVLRGELKKKIDSAFS